MQIPVLYLWAKAHVREKSDETLIALWDRWSASDGADEGFEDVVFWELIRRGYNPQIEGGWIEQPNEQGCFLRPERQK